MGAAWDARSAAIGPEKTAHAAENITVAAPAEPAAAPGGNR